MLGKYCCHICLFADQQYSRWLLLTLNNKNGRPGFHMRGAESHKTAHDRQFHLGSSRGDTAKDLMSQQCLVVWSTFIFH